MPNPIIAAVADGQAVGDSNTVFVDITLVDVPNDAVFTIDCPLTAAVTIERAPGSWNSGGATLLGGGVWSATPVAFNDWQATISVAGTTAEITVNQLNASPTTGIVRVRVDNLGAAACTVTEGGNATIERVLADPSLSALGYSGDTSEKAVVTLIGTVDYTQFTTGSASLSALPDLRAAWQRDSSDVLAFTLGATAFAGTGGAPAQADFTVPGLYAPTNTHFQLRGFYDLDSSGTHEASEPQNTEELSVPVSPTDFHIVLVIDRSGSMSGTLSGGTSKWEGAVAAAHLWSDFMLAFRSGDDHRMGIVTFEHGSCGWGVAGGADDIALRNPSPGNLGALSVFDVDALAIGAPGSCTPIGDALVFAMDKLVVASLNHDEQRVIVLLTDGYENSGKVTIKGTPPAGGVTTWAAERLVGARQIVNQHLDLYTIAVGQETEEDLLNDLPNDPAGGVGYYHLTNNASDLLETFAGMLGHSLDAQPLSPANSVAPPDPGPPADTQNAKYVQVNAGEQRLAVAIVRDDATYTPRLAHRNQGSIAPDFTPIATGNPAVTSYERLGHTMVVVDLPALLGSPAPAKEWRIQLRNAGNLTKNLDGALLVMVDLRVKAEISFDRHAYRTGQVMRVACSIVAGAQPVTGAEVTVEVAAPGEGLGTFLASNSGVYKRGSAEDQRGDRKAPKQHMFVTLLGALGLPGLPVVKPVFADGSDRLFDDGGHDDGAADDGVYANSFAATLKEGSYRFRFRVRGELSPGNRFDRVFVRSTWVGVLTDAAASPITMVALPSPGAGLVAVRVNIVPRSQSGEYLGPFRADELVFSTSSGTWAGAVESHLDGRYSRVLHHREGESPVVQVSVNGQPVKPVVIGGDDDLCKRYGCLGLFFALWRCLLRKLGIGR